MGSVRTWRPSPSLAISFLALFVALSGTAIAVSKNSIKTSHIAKNAIRASDIKKNQILARHLKRNQVLARHVKNGTLTAADLNAATLGDLTGPPGAPGQDGQQGPQGPPGAIGGGAGGDLTGTYPNPSIATGAVNSAKVVDNSLVSSDLASNSVTGSELANGSVSSAKILPFAVGSSHVADSSLTTNDVANGSLTGFDVAFDGLTGADIDEGTLDLDIQQVAATSASNTTSPKSIPVHCPSGFEVIAADAQINGGTSPPTTGNQKTAVAITDIDTRLPDTIFGPGPDARVRAFEIGGTTAPNWSLTVEAICVRLAG